MDPLFELFAKEGLLGAIIVVLIFALRSRDASYREVQEKRIDEHREMTERALTAINANTEATKAAGTGFANLVNIVDEVKERLPASGRRLK